MSSGSAPWWQLFQLIFGGIVALCLFNVYRSKSPELKEQGHLVISLIPWFQIALAYSVAFYIRLGFGSWPRCCIDNPELPMLNFLLPVILLGTLFVVWFSPLLWLGWFIIRLYQGLTRWWIVSTAVFVPGILILIFLYVYDPWKFWDWLFD